MFSFFRQIKSERELKSLLWKIDYSGIVLANSDYFESMDDDTLVRLFFSVRFISDPKNMDENILKSNVIFMLLDLILLIDQCRSP